MKSKKVAELEDQVDELTIENSKLQRSARTDELTGLGNRYALREDFESYKGKNVIVFLVDVDSFKGFNDTYGHDMGDEVLKAVASELQTFCWDANCYRYGGDEFLVIVETEDLYHTETSMENLEIALEYVTIDDLDRPICITFGSAYGTINSMEDLRRFIHYADESLYDVKVEKKED